MISPILAAKMGYGQPQRAGAARDRCARQEPEPDGPRGRPRRPELPVLGAGQEPRAGKPGLLPVPVRLPARLRPGRDRHGRRQGARASRPTTKTRTRTKTRPKKKPEPKDELPEEFVGQAIKHIVMHEVGHSLGLRHNFKASTMLTADQLNDTAITHVKGLVGSVMDYSPINIAPKGKKQGDYYTTTIGPYDYWAIEYAYKPVEGDEATELKKIAARAPEHDLVYATDEDSFLNDDPYVNRWDLGLGPVRVRQGADRAGDGALEGPGRARGQGRRIVGADPPRLQHLARAVGRRRDPRLAVRRRPVGLARSQGRQGRPRPDRPRRRGQAARVPEVPHRRDPHRQGVPVLTGLAPPAGNRAVDRTGAPTASSGPGVDISVLERILGIQKIVLGHCLSAATLARLENQQLQADPGADPLRMDEVFRSLTDGIWSDLDHLPAPTDDKAGKFALSTIRRNLQREYLRRLSSMVLRQQPELLRRHVSATSSSCGAATARCRPTPAPWPGCTSRRSPAGSARSWRRAT